MSTQLDAATELLKKHGPLASQDFANRLVEGGHSPSASTARKVIERACTADRVKSTHPVRFDKAYLYYLESHRGKQYAQAVRKLLPDKPPFHRVYKTLLANKGWITLGQIGKASGCLPTGDTSAAGGRSDLATVTAQLLKIGLLDEVAGDKELFRIGTQFGTVAIKRAAFLRKLELEQGLLQILRDWLRNCYLLSYESHTTRNTPTTAMPFNQSLWDLHGPIYFGPFSSGKSLRRADYGGSFVAAEILGYRQFTINDAQSMVERVNSIAHRWKSISFVPIVLAPFFSAEAFQLLRMEGVICVTLRDVFGPNIDELIKRFSQAVAADEPTPENLTNIEQSLQLAKGTIIDEGLLGNLKGALFEVVVALAYRALGYDTTLQKIIRKPDEGEEFEIDVVASKADASCTLAECKGRHEGYLESKVEVERHFAKRCRAAADAYGWNVVEAYKSVHAVFITSGDLSEDARAYSEVTKSSHGIACSVMTRGALLAFLQSAGQPRLVEIVKQYY